MEILDNKKIDIVTLTHNRMQFAAATIWSIINYTDYPYRIIVVDNGSTDGTREWLIKMKDMGFIHELVLNDKNLGIAEAKNQGMALVNWDCGYAVLTDSDIVLPLLDPSWMRLMFESMVRHPKLGMLSCNLDPVNHNPATHAWWYDHQQRNLKKDDVALVPTGFHMTIVPKDIFEDIKKEINGQAFWGDSLYGEVDAHYRESVGRMGYWVGVQTQVSAIHLGWMDKRFFSEYDLMKRLERFKAEEGRRKRDGKDVMRP